MRHSGLRWMGWAVLALGMTGVAAWGQSPMSSPITAACGAEDTRYTTKRDATNPPAPDATGKALVYFIEEMPQIGIGISTKIRAGVDGQWVGGLERQSYMAVVLEPGVHHLCARYEGKVALGEQGAVELHRLNVEAGKTYYMLYRATVDKTSGLVAFFQEVDEDEGQMLVQRVDHVTSAPKKK